MEQVFFNFPTSQLEILIKKWVKEVIEEIPEPTNEKLFGIKEAQVFTGLSKQTIYNKVSNREIPHQRKGGRLYFSSTELSEWIKSGKRKTNHEIKSDASLYSSNTSTF